MAPKRPAPTAPMHLRVRRRLPAPPEPVAPPPAPEAAPAAPADPAPAHEAAPAAPPPAADAAPAAPADPPPAPEPAPAAPPPAPEAAPAAPAVHAPSLAPEAARAAPAPVPVTAPLRTLMRILPPRELHIHPTFLAAATAQRERQDLVQQGREQRGQRMQEQRIFLDDNVNRQEILQVQLQHALHVEVDVRDSVQRTGLLRIFHGMGDERGRQYMERVMSRLMRNSSLVGECRLLTFPGVDNPKCVAHLPLVRVDVEGNVVIGAHEHPKEYIRVQVLNAYFSVQNFVRFIRYMRDEDNFDSTEAIRRWWRCGALMASHRCGRKTCIAPEHIELEDEVYQRSRDACHFQSAEYVAMTGFTCPHGRPAPGAPQGGRGCFHWSEDAIRNPQQLAQEPRREAIDDRIALLYAWGLPEGTDDIPFGLSGEDYMTRRWENDIRDNVEEIQTCSIHLGAPSLPDAGHWTCFQRDGTLSRPSQRRGSTVVEIAGRLVSTSVFALFMRHALSDEGIDQVAWLNEKLECSHLCCNSRCIRGEHLRLEYWRYQQTRDFCHHFSYRYAVFACPHVPRCILWRDDADPEVAGGDGAAPPNLGEPGPRQGHARRRRGQQ